MLTFVFIVQTFIILEKNISFYLKTKFSLVFSLTLGP